MVKIFLIIIFIIANSISSLANEVLKICKFCDLRYAQYQNLSLDNADYSGAYMFRINFTRSSLKNSIFESSNLIRSILERGNFSHSNFNKADLSSSNLYGSTFTNASFIFANLDDSYLEAAELSYADLTGSSIKGANLILSLIHI